MKTTAGRDALPKYSTRGASLDMVPPQFLEQGEFLRILRIEQKRALRSGMAFGLVRIAIDELQSGPQRDSFREALTRSLRDTDFCGWFEEGITAGVIFIELRRDTAQAAGQALTAELQAKLTGILPEIWKPRLSFSIFPLPEVGAAVSSGQSEQPWEPRAVGRR